MQKAFVLGAGLGTRLKSLTDRIPKPLIPVYQKPLISYAFDHLLDAGLRECVVNTHHHAQAYAKTFPDSRYRGAPLTFRHEPNLLETAGGIANIRDLVGDAPFLVYNGDILTDLPLAPLLAAHAQSGDLITLALRSSGPALHVAFDPGAAKVVDIRNQLETGARCGHQFTGIYAVHPGFFAYLTPGKKESVIPIFLKLIREQSAVGGVVIAEGAWSDLGDRRAYLRAVAALSHIDFPAYGKQPEQLRLHPGALIDPTARVCPQTSIGAGAVVEADAQITNSILWPGARVATGSILDRCIVRDGALASGKATDADF